MTHGKELEVLESFALLTESQKQLVLDTIYDLSPPPPPDTAE